jgi:cyclophilin family peptidyl-prolyl cis-trans isomerase
VLSVLGRDKLRGARKQAYLQRASAKDGPVREAALELIAEHAELGEAYRVLAEALAAKSLGVVASAAHVLARYPERANRSADASSEAHSAPRPDSSVVQALAPAYAAAREQNSIEVQSLLLDAIGALQILSLKESVNAACSSDNPTLREHAEKALHLLGEQGRQCDQFTPSKDSSDNAEPSSARVQLDLDTDAGPLTITLDPTFAPNAVARVVGLARAGFYDGTAIHRVVPGFVAQFGDPSGDGYGGDGKPPLRCETSPLPFLNGSVGVALSGRDTGSSQLFVTLGRYPHLDGQYTWLGQAGPGWDRVAAGDRILHARLSAVP